MDLLDVETLIRLREVKSLSTVPGFYNSAEPEQIYNLSQEGYICSLVDGLTYILTDKGRGWLQRGRYLDRER